MIETMLEFCHYGVILVFGIYLSAAFLGVIMNRRNVLILFGFSCFVGMLNVISFVALGTEMTEKVYPLIIHLPLVLFLKLFYKTRKISALLSVLVAYLCCQISNWIGLFCLQLTQFMWVYYAVRITVDVLLLVFLVRYAANAVAQILRKPTKDVMILGLVPLVYYAYDYAVTVYTDMLYSGGKVISEFLAFLLCIFYVAFVIIYFKQYEEKCEAEHRNQLTELQRIQSQREVDRMKRSQYEISILRHDMRHFLNDILGYVEAEDSERAKAYICEIIEHVDQTVTKKYCNNKIVNMILSSYESVIKEAAIAFDYSVRIPAELHFADSDISSILSNGLENAVHAVSFLPVEKRKIKLDMRMNNDKLLISIKNTYCGKLKIVDGLPQTNVRGHGIGTKSIRYVTEKLKGNCDFSMTDEYFILRIVL